MAVRAQAPDANGGPESVDALGVQRIEAEAEGLSFVYVIGDPDGPQKIGISARPDQRLIALQTSNPLRLVEAGRVPCTRREARAVEQRAHAALAAHRLAGEWFSVGPDAAIAAVEAAAGRPCVPPPPPEAPRPPLPPVEWAQITPTQCRVARAALRWTVKVLSERSGVAPSTIARFEAGQRQPIASIHAAIRHALIASGGVSFSVDDNGWHGTHAREGL